ncbi:UPF0603 protein [Hibiscus syriacus]|uniref:UPF0603 protein n=1 Tax=Hibiscus syriacus TaxID=106335 RepID=A0A6A2XMV0_HIBSY|nr:UPF0603 protein [Hibiscus syriacus]
MASEFDVINEGPPKESYVVDDANVLSRVTKSDLKRLLSDLESRKNFHINFVTVRKLTSKADAFEYADQVLEKWYPTLEEGSNKGIVVLVTSQKEGAVTGGPAFIEAVGENILDATVTENLPVLATEEKYNEAIYSSAKRLVAAIDGLPDPGGPTFKDNKRESNFKSREETEEKRGQFSLVVGEVGVDFVALCHDGRAEFSDPKSFFTLGKTRKMQKAGTTKVPEQSAVEEETLPSWWAGQKEELEGRIQKLEEGMTENRGYLQRILQLVNQAVKEKDSSQSVKSQPQAAEKQEKKVKEQKLEIASMYLAVKAETWCDGYIMQKYRVTWHEFEKGSVEEYQEKLKELRPYLLRQNMHLGEAYFVSSFISGLKEELKHKVKVLEPKNLSETYRQAKFYELANEIEGKKYKSANNFFSYNPSNIQQSSGNKGFLPKTFPLTTNNKQSLLEYRRANNFCFKCGEIFVPGHQCKVRKCGAYYLEDSRFYQSTAKSNKMSWKMQGYEFQHDFRVLSLGGSDMVLGVDWMKEFSPILMDFKAKTLSFDKEGGECGDKRYSEVTSTKTYYR